MKNVVSRQRRAKAVWKDQFWVVTPRAPEVTALCVEYYGGAAREVLQRERRYSS